MIHTHTVHWEISREYETCGEDKSCFLSCLLTSMKLLGCSARPSYLKRQLTGLTPWTLKFTLCKPLSKHTRAFYTGQKTQYPIKVRSCFPCKTVPLKYHSFTLLPLSAFNIMMKGLMFHQTVPRMLALARREPLIHCPLSSLLLETSH